MKISRKMRRQDRTMCKKETEEFVKANNLGHLGTLGIDGYPYVVPINYYYTAGKFILHSALLGEKVDNIRANPRVCFTVTNYNDIIPGDNPCAYAVNYQSAIAFGQAAIIEGEEKQALLQQFAASFIKETGEVQLPPESMEKVAVIVIEVETMTGKKCCR